MNTPSVEQLNQDFSLQGDGYRLSFKAGKGDVPVVEIHNGQAQAVISLQGAQVLSWIPAGGGEVIWVSEDAKFAPGKSVRGGVPICWPWFGPHETNPAYPGHGFARTVFWQVRHTEALASGETQITFQLNPGQLGEQYQPMWPQPTLAEYRVTVGKVLGMALKTVNQGAQPITIGQALHTYFSVDDLTQTTVLGLDGRDYMDKTDAFKRKTQVGPVVIESEVDRVYLQTPDDNIIDDKKRKIIIKKQGSHSTVVWNPWKEAAEKMGDLGPNGYLKMLCVESANALEDTVTIKAGESHTMHVSYEVEA